MTPLYISDDSTPLFESKRLDVDIVCAGDSLTGWNNFGQAQDWPFPTYPRYLQQACEPLGLQVADGGIAGEVSDNGPSHVRRYLDRFPNSRYVIIGFGTNDLGTWPDLKQTSQRIIANLNKMVQAVRKADKKTVLFNVPNANEATLPPSLARDCRQRRDYHNARLLEFCTENQLPLADIRSQLLDRHFGDDLHPNQIGAKRIADTVFQVLKSVRAEVS